MPKIDDELLDLAVGITTYKDNDFCIDKKVDVK